MTTRNKTLAILNGVETTATKYGRKWLVGGDFPQKGDSVIIAAWHKDVENGGGFYAWHKLQGCFLRFNDFLTDSELKRMEAL